MKVSLTLLLLLSTCRPQPDPGIPPPRIVSLIPSATEIIFALGLGDHVTGATRYCTRPEAAKTIPRVGGILDVSVEAVLARRPTLVIGSPSVLEGRVGTLVESAGARLLPLTFETPESVVDGVLAIGKAVGRESEAAALARTIEADMDRLRGRAARKPPTRVLFVVGRSPIVVASRASFLGDLLDRAGVENIAGSRAVPFPTWSLELVLQADPDVVIDGAVEASDLGEVLAAAGLRAARAGRVIRLKDDAILRPGPSTARAALELADRLLY